MSKSPELTKKRCLYGQAKETDSQFDTWQLVSHFKTKIRKLMQGKNVKEKNVLGGILPPRKPYNPFPLAASMLLHLCSFSQKMSRSYSRARNSRGNSDLSLFCISLSFPVVRPVPKSSIQEHKSLKRGFFSLSTHRCNMDQDNRTTIPACDLTLRGDFPPLARKCFYGQHSKTFSQSQLFPGAQAFGINLPCLISQLLL